MSGRRHRTAAGAGTIPAKTTPIAAGTEPNGPTVAAIAAGVATLAMLYGATAAPCAWWGDGLELASAAWTLGIPHPTGYPLYIVSGHAWMRLLGWLDPGRALTLYNTVCLTLAGGVLIRLLISVASDGRRISVAAAACTGLVTGLWLAAARTVWEHATIAEVYPLTYLLAAVIVAYCWSRRDQPTNALQGATLGVLTGLLALNHYSGLAMAPLALACTIDWTFRARGRRWLVPAATVGTFLAMLSGYLYLLLRARANPPLNWGDPSDLQRLWWTLSGGQFSQIKVGGDPRWIMNGLARWLDWWGSQWLIGAAGDSAAVGWRVPQMLLGLPLVTVAVAGLIDLTRRQRAIGLGLLGMPATTALIGAFYHIMDIDGYFMVALPAVGIGWIVFARRAVIAVERIPLRLLRADALGILAAVVLAFVGFANWPWVGKHGDAAPLAWGSRALELVAPDALVLTTGDNDIYPLWYQQMVLGRRPDVTVLGANFIFSGWYRRYFERPERPRIPLRIEQRPIAIGKLPFDVALIGGTILPNLRAGRAVYLAYRDPLLEDLFAARALGPLLAPTTVEWFTRRYPDTLPSMHLIELRPNPLLATLDDAGLAGALEDWYRRHGQADNRGW